MLKMRHFQVAGVKLMKDLTAGIPIMMVVKLRLEKKLLMVVQIVPMLLLS